MFAVVLDGTWKNEFQFMHSTKCEWVLLNERTCVRFFPQTFVSSFFSSTELFMHESEESRKKTATVMCTTSQTLWAQIIAWQIWNNNSAQPIQMANKKQQKTHKHTPISVWNYNTHNRNYLTDLLFFEHIRMVFAVLLALYGCRSTANCCNVRLLIAHRPTHRMHTAQFTNDSGFWV